jgi:hypothetical protein
MKKLIALVAFVLASAEVFATTYYVNSVTGSDSNPGTPAAPFQSFYKFNQITLSPGDVLAFAAGTAYTGYFELTQSGAAGLPITITSYGTGTPPEFTNPNEWYAIRLTGNYLVVDGVKIRDTYESGAVIWGSNCIVKNSEMTNTGFGVMVAAVNAKVLNNYIHDTHMIVNSPGGDDDYGANGVNLTTGTNGAEVAYNHIIGCVAPSYDYGTDGGAFEFYGNVSNVNVHHNWCEGNNGVFEFGGGTISNVTISYNVTLDNGVLGGLHLAGTFAANITAIRLENNTVVEAYNGIANNVLWFNGTSRQNQFSAKNNIFHYSGAYSAFSNGTRFVHANNLYYSPTNVALGFRKGSTEIVANPLFVNPATDDYTLQATSPAVNAGTALGYTADYLGNPIVGAPDLGAYERQ